jgi:ribonuclease VapC
MSGAVLDASAVLAVLLEEPGSVAVVPYIGVGHLSVVNYSEVVARLSERGAPPEVIDAQISVLDLRIAGFEQETARAAGLLREATKEYGLSFADRACLATAQRLGLPVVTADRDWSKLDIGISVELIR